MNVNVSVCGTKKNEVKSYDDWHVVKRIPFDIPHRSQYYEYQKTEHGLCYNDDHCKLKVCVKESVNDRPSSNYWTMDQNHTECSVAFSINENNSGREEMLILCRTPNVCVKMMNEIRDKVNKTPFVEQQQVNYESTTRVSIKQTTF